MTFVTFRGISLQVDRGECRYRFRLRFGVVRRALIRRSVFGRLGRRGASGEPTVRVLAAEVGREGQAFVLRLRGRQWRPTKMTTVVGAPCSAASARRRGAGRRLGTEGRCARAGAGGRRDGGRCAGAVVGRRSVGSRSKILVGFLAKVPADRVDALGALPGVVGVVQGIDIGFDPALYNPEKISSSLYSVAKAHRRGRRVEGRLHRRGHRRRGHRLRRRADMPEFAGPRRERAGPLVRLGRRARRRRPVRPRHAHGRHHRGPRSVGSARPADAGRTTRSATSSASRRARGSST